MKTTKIKGVELRITESELKEKLGVDKALSLRICDKEHVFDFEGIKETEVYFKFEEIKEK